MNRNSPSDGVDQAEENERSGLDRCLCGEGPQLAFSLVGPLLIPLSDTLCSPSFGLLGETQAHMATGDEIRRSGCRGFSASRSGTGSEVERALAPVLGSY